MQRALSPSAAKVQKVLDESAVSCEVKEFTVSSRTAEDAAAAVGCQLGQIIKSLVFKGKNSGKPLLALVSGKNRVDEKLLEAACNEPVCKADAEFVRVRTGFAIGGIPPLGHLEQLCPIIDQDLMEYPQVWAAAGTPNAVFCITPKELLVITKGVLAKLC